MMTFEAFFSIHQMPTNGTKKKTIPIKVDVFGGLGTNKKKAAYKTKRATQFKKRKNGPYFLLNPGCLVGILIMAYYNPHITALVV